MDGLKQLQQHPFEIFQVADKTNPYSTAIWLMAFCAYPRTSDLPARKAAAASGYAWLFRRAREEGNKFPIPDVLKRTALSSRTVENRLLKAARRFELEALPLVGIALELCFRRSDAPEFVRRALALTLGGSSVVLRAPKDYRKDRTVFREFLRNRKALVALEDEKQLIADFKRRKWDAFYPALPLLTALFFDVLKYSPSTGRFDIEVPGFGTRALLFTLIRNPHLWVQDIIYSTEVRRQFFSLYLDTKPFAEIRSAK